MINNVKFTVLQKKSKISIIIVISLLLLSIGCINENKEKEEVAKPNGEFIYESIIQLPIPGEYKIIIPIAENLALNDSNKIIFDNIVSSIKPSSMNLVNTSKGYGIEVISNKSINLSSKSDNYDYMGLELSMIENRSGKINHTHWIYFESEAIKEIKISISIWNEAKDSGSGKEEFTTPKYLYITNIGWQIINTNSHKWDT